MSSSLFGLMLVSEGAAGAPMSPFEVNFGLFFWTWATFLGLFLLLWKFVWPQMLAATEAREAKIKQQLAEAERLNAEAKASVAEQTKLLADARAQASTILAETKAAAEKERSMATEKTRAEAELRREAVDLALAAAGKLIGQRLESDADKKIVTDYLATVGTGK